MALQSDKLRLLRRIPEIRFEEELRGYSKQQVDRVLENLAPLADEIEALQNRLAEAETRAASAEARLIESGGREVDLAPVAAPVALPATPADFDETLRNTLLLAQRTADETVRRANDDAANITGSGASRGRADTGRLPSRSCPTRRRHPGSPGRAPRRRRRRASRAAQRDHRDCRGPPLGHRVRADPDRRGRAGRVAQPDRRPAGHPSHVGR